MNLEHRLLKQEGSKVRATWSENRSWLRHSLRVVHLITDHFHKVCDCLSAKSLVVSGSDSHSARGFLLLADDQDVIELLLLICSDFLVEACLREV